MKKLSRPALISMIALLGFGGGLAAARLLLIDADSLAEPTAATWLRTERPLPEFELSDHRGQVFGKSRLVGDWSFLFFGFTHCPDICPTTMGHLDAVARRLEERPDIEPFQVVFVSVDPGRDTIGRLASYVPFFNPGFIGLTGEINEIDNLTSNLGVAYHHVPNTGADPVDDEAVNYTVDHTAAIFLVDPKGHLAAVFTPPHDPATLLEDFLIISGQSR